MVRALQPATRHTHIDIRFLACRAVCHVETVPSKATRQSREGHPTGGCEVCRRRPTAPRGASVDHRIDRAWRLAAAGASMCPCRTPWCASASSPQPVKPDGRRVRVAGPYWPALDIRAARLVATRPAAGSSTDVVGWSLGPWHPGC